MGVFYEYNKPDKDREILYRDEEGCPCFKFIEKYELYDEPSQVYSYIMVLYEMFSGKVPFEEMSEDEVD